MRLVVCVNHSFPHCGGSEKVVHQISSSMVNDFGHEVFVLSRSLNRKTKHEGVNYEPCSIDGDGFLKQIRQLWPEQTLIYSDCFNHWGHFLKNIEEIPGKKSIALVGMNRMISRPHEMKMFVENAKRIGVITHSDNYQDYSKCIDAGIKPHVINNGVDLREFDSNSFDFRSHYKITTPHIVLCVSTFFPGKGQEHLVPVLKNLYQRRSDFTAVFCSNDVNFPFAKMLSDNVSRELKKCDFQHKFLVNIPREHIIGAFKQSSVFAFPSQKEVAPLVLLESQAAGLPWVAMPVGNAPLLAGGMLVPYLLKDVKGLRYDHRSYSQFADNLFYILESPAVKKKFGSLGRAQVEKEFDWQVIKEKYRQVLLPEEKDVKSPSEHSNPGL